MTGGSLISLPSQDSIGTSSSICGDNVSITSSTRRTSGSFNSASRQRYNHQLGSRHVSKSSNNALTSKTGDASGTKRSSISSAQSQGNLKGPNIKNIYVNINVLKTWWYKIKQFHILWYLGAVSEDRKGAKLPDDDSEAAETNRKDREARSIAIEKVYY